MPRIAVIHALALRPRSIDDAFLRDWPDARRKNLLDDNLSADLAQGARRVDAARQRRFNALGDCARSTGADGRQRGPGDSAPARLGGLNRTAAVLRRAVWAVVLTAVGSVAQAAGAAGEKAFAPCASCHEVGPSARAGFGPPLNRLFGRRAGTAEGFKYSEAMKKSGVVWTDATLAAFVKDPGSVVPGTRMRFYGLGDERRIADLLDYLHASQAP